MSALEIAGLRVAYGRGAPVLDGVDLAVPDGTLTALLGPSGCGKSTLLKAVAGLLDPAAGDVRVAGRSVLGLPAERRPVGLVFQKPLLFPHLSVADNVGFGLRMRGAGRAERGRRVGEMLERVGLAGLERRRVGQLSGGQEQRVALARALVTAPPVLLLDEPFSQLDADLRVRMRELVRALQRELSVTMLFVTHDRQEALDVADAIALLLDGRLEAAGPPADFYARPATLRAARFFGPVNELPGTLDGDGFACALGRLRVPAHPGVADGPGVLVVRPEALRLVAGGTAVNTVPAVVRAVRFRGTHLAVTLAAHDVELAAAVAPAPPVEPGERVHVQLPPSACRVLPAAPPVGAQERVRA